jgi:tetratricopeptide (TPR) repeat protein
MDYEISEEEFEIVDILQAADVMLEIGDLEAAISYLEWGIKQYPSDERIAVMLGECYLYNAEPEKAIRPLQWGMEILEEAHSEDSWELHYLLGCALSRTKKFTPALKHLEEANNQMTNHPEILRNIGWILCMQKNTLSGRTILRRSIALDPENPLTYNDLGASYMFEGKFKEAKKWISKAVDKDPSDPNIAQTSQKLQELTNMSTLFPKTRKTRRISHIKNIKNNRNPKTQ